MIFRLLIKSYNKNCLRLIFVCLFFFCNFIYDNIEDIDFIGELIFIIFKEFKFCFCYFISNILCIYFFGFFCKFFIYVRIKR